MDQQYLPLNGSQLGIWLADQVAENKQGYLIAHCIEVRGALQPELLSRAIQRGLAEADTVTARYLETEAGARQQLRPACAADGIDPPVQLDLRGYADARQRADAWMQDDMAAPFDLSGGHACYRQALFQVGQDHWLWYQRFHHIMLDGFSFLALTRRIAAHYGALATGAVAAPSPFAPAAVAVEEYEAYQRSDARERDRAFWAGFCEALPPAASLSLRNAPPSGRVHSVAWEFPADTAAGLQRHAASASLAVPDLVHGLLAAYLYRMTGQKRQAIGMPFMRRMGSRAINALAPAVNVLPLSVEMAGGMDWFAVARAFRAAVHGVRPHQRYEAEQIQRDAGLVGTGRKLYGALVNFKMFDYRLDLAGLQGLTHHLATGPVDDLEFNLQVAEHISLELRADAARYEVAELEQHVARLAGMLQQWLADPQRELQALAPATEDELARIGAWSRGPEIAPPDVDRLSAILARQAAARPDALALVRRRQPELCRPGGPCRTTGAPAAYPGRRPRPGGGGGDSPLGRVGGRDAGRDGMRSGVPAAGPGLPGGPHRHDVRRCGACLAAVHQCGCHRATHRHGPHRRRQRRRTHCVGPAVLCAAGRGGARRAAAGR